MKSVNERIEQIRRLMKDKNIDVYYIPNGDDHLSEEYTAPYYQCKSYISGFSGDSGTVVITKDFAGLWTDGRFFTQAEGELKGTCVELMRLRQEGVPDPIPFAIASTPENGTLGFDGRVVGTQDVREIAAELGRKHAGIHMSDDLAGEVWGEERPAMPMEEIYVLPKKYVGETVEERVARVREAMELNHADVFLVTKLEDPCWLLNIRGNDIACTPVAYAFAMVTKTNVTYYIHKSKVNDTVQKYFKEHKITLKEYSEIEKDLSALHSKTVWADLTTLNAYLYSHLATDNSLINTRSMIENFRAVKNATEIKNTKKAHIKDAVAMCKFLYWVKENRSSKNLSEYSAQEELYRLRAEQADYIEPSFETISAYGPNAAMMHYTATKENFAKCKNKGFLLVDSGGTYKDGTTDITRTIALGALTDEEKMLYTLVLKGHVDLCMPKFLYGTTGNNLDILARGPMWNANIDYQCGTGHGVGHVLGVHEGPHGIRWGMGTRQRSNAVLEQGMIVTNEPGIYLPHKLGIRIENEMLVVKDKKNFYGQFLKFEQLTFVPYDREAIDVRYLNDVEVAYINEYHQQVLNTVGGYLKGKEKAWLKEACAPIKR